MRYCLAQQRKLPGAQELSFEGGAPPTSDASRYERYLQQQDAMVSLERKFGSLVRLVVP